jgi:hypothetical protein
MFLHSQHKQRLLASATLMSFCIASIMAIAAYQFNV